MSQRTAFWLAWSLWALCVVLIGLALLFDFLTHELAYYGFDPDALGLGISPRCKRTALRRAALPRDRRQIVKTLRQSAQCPPPCEVGRCRPGGLLRL